MSTFWKLRILKMVSSAKRVYPLDNFLITFRNCEVCAVYEQPEPSCLVQFGNRWRRRWTKMGGCRSTIVHPNGVGRVFAADWAESSDRKR